MANFDLGVKVDLEELQVALWAVSAVITSTLAGASSRNLAVLKVTSFCVAETHQGQSIQSQKVQSFSREEQGVYVLITLN